jgi:hypothetical protein
LPTSAIKNAKKFSPPGQKNANRQPRRHAPPAGKSEIPDDVILTRRVKFFGVFDRTGLQKRWYLSGRHVIKMQLHKNSTRFSLDKALTSDLTHEFYAVAF